MFKVLVMTPLCPASVVRDQPGITRIKQNFTCNDIYIIINIRHHSLKVKQVAKVRMTGRCHFALNDLHNAVQAPWNFK